MLWKQDYSLTIKVSVLGEPVGSENIFQKNSEILSQIKSQALDHTQA